MTRLHHPRNRAERLRIKAKKDFKVDRAAHVQDRIEREALEQKEAFDELRREILTKASDERTDD